MKHAEDENQVLRRQAEELFPILHNTIQENLLLRKMVAAPANRNIDSSFHRSLNNSRINGTLSNGSLGKDTSRWLRYATYSMIAAVFVLMANWMLVPNPISLRPGIYQRGSYSGQVNHWTNSYPSSPITRGAIIAFSMIEKMQPVSLRYF